MLFAEMSDGAQLAMWAIILVVVKQVLEWITSWLTAGAIAKKTEEAAAKVAVKVEEVKEVLAKATEESSEKLGAIHTLVNSNRGETLTIASVALDRVAELTKHPKDIAAADVARKLLREHQAQQALVDKRDNAGTTLRQDVAAIPEKTAKKVVEKLKEEPPQPMH